MEQLRAGAEEWPSEWTRPPGRGLAAPVLLGAVGAAAVLAGLVGLAWWAAAGTADDLVVLGASLLGVGFGVVLLCLADASRWPRPEDREQLGEVTDATRGVEYGLVIVRRSGRGHLAAAGHAGLVLAGLGGLVADSGGLYGWVAVGLAVLADRVVARSLAAPVRRVELTSTAILVVPAQGQGTIRVLWDDVQAVVPVERQAAGGRTRAVGLDVRPGAVQGSESAVAALTPEHTPPAVAIPTAGLLVRPERLLALVRRFHAAPDEREWLLGHG